ncbi:hypothetical protein L1887_17933 [Cichorium endivia]|nr:hypothetical protein L1887_17933 [Cichorium endivia]
MAQRTEKEETEFKVVPETLTLCINNCGVVGNPATNNMCQKCFSATTTTTSSSTTSTQRTRGRSGSLRSPARSTSRDVSVDLVVDRTVVTIDEQAKEKTTTKVVNRCSGCRKRVGLTGFRCRCGDLFCADHRYSDRHDCTYDYKTAGREAIARDNPVVKAAKIVRI